MWCTGNGEERDEDVLEKEKSVLRSENKSYFRISIEYVRKTLIL
jgi:hypothetical protein